MLGLETDSCGREWPGGWIVAASHVGKPPRSHAGWGNEDSTQTRQVNRTQPVCGTGGFPEEGAMVGAR